MAGKTAEQKRIEELEAQLAAKDEVIATAKKAGQKIASPVAGSYTAKWKDDVSGDDITKKVEFKNGRTRVRIQDGSSVSSEALLKIANGRKASAKEIKAFPALVDVTKEAAEAILTKYAKMGAGFLK